MNLGRPIVADNSVVSGNSDGDYIEICGEGATVQTYGGNDTIVVYQENNGFWYGVPGADSAVIYAGADNDTIEDRGKNSTIYGGAGNDSIAVHSKNGSFGTYVNGGSGNDTIYLKTEYPEYGSSYDKSLEHITISGGEGNDIFSFNTKSNTTISLVITDLENGDTLRNNYITNIGLEKSVVGGNIVLTEPGEGGINVTLQGVSDISQVSNVIYRTKEDRKTLGEIFGSSPIPDPDPDPIIDTGTTVQPAPVDTGTKTTVTSRSDGSVYIKNTGDSTILTGTSYNDSIYNWGDYVTINTGAGNDTIENWGDTLKIYAEAGDDSIYSCSFYGTINAGTGNDTVSLSSYRGVIEYTTGDGNDVIFNLGTTDTLDIKGAQYSSVTSGNDVIISVGTGNITLKDAASLSAVNVNGTASVQPPTPTGSYDFYGSNATISAGSSSVVSSYQYYDQVNFKTQLSDFSVDGDNLLIHSNSGTLTILNARNNIMKYTENGNVIAQSYLAQASGDVNRQMSGYYEVIIGAENADNHIYAGSGGSSLWGGNGGADTLTGGAGSDQFIYTFGSGNDIITNANADDIVSLNDASMAQILTANVESSRIYATFTDGGSLEVQSSANVGFKVGNEIWAANRSNGTWYKK